MQIAIDGPSGAGKSTIAKLLAAKMNCIYLDTGAMYRTVGLLAVRTNTDRHDDAALAELLKNADIRVLRVDGSQHMALGGEDVETLIRTPEISMAASDVASCPSVRRALVALQQKIAAGCDVVMDGRDIGTVVFPDAELKIFMTADPRVRACRRYDELRAKGDPVSLEEIERNVRERDKADMGRAISPLRQAEDAIVLDNSCMTVGEQMAWFRKEFEQVTR